MDTGMIIEAAVKSLILVLGMTVGFAYLTLFERKVLARIQVRIGPNRAGPQGLLQPIADAVKLIFKEELVPAGAYKLVFLLAPMITVFPALVITAAVAGDVDLSFQPRRHQHHGALGVQQRHGGEQVGDDEPEQGDPVDASRA